MIYNLIALASMPLFLAAVDSEIQSETGYVLSISGDGERIAAVEPGANRLYLLNSQSGEVVSEYRFDHLIRGAVFGADRNHVCVFQDHCDITHLIWDENGVVSREDLNLRLAFDPCFSAPSLFDITSDRDFISVPTSDGKLLIAPLFHSNETTSIAIDAGGTIVAVRFVGEASDEVLVLSHRLNPLRSMFVLHYATIHNGTWQVRQSLPLPELHAGSYAAFSADEEYLFCQHYVDGVSYVSQHTVDTHDGTVEMELVALQVTSNVQEFAVSKNMRVLMHMLESPEDVAELGRMVFFDLEEQRRLATAAVQGEYVISMIAMESGDVVVSGNDGGIYCLSVENEEAEWFTSLPLNAP